MKEKLFQYLLRENKKFLYIKDLKQAFTPIELATQLRSLESQEMVVIDWQKKIIWVRLDLTSVFLKKNELTKYKRETPDYMKTESININEPYVG